MCSLIYLIAPSGSLRHSLTMLLTALGTGQQIEQFDTISAAMQYDPDRSPELILCDVVMLDETALDDLARLRGRWPHARLAVLAEGEGQATQLAGSATVIPTGAAAPRLRSMLSELLRNERDMS